MKDHMFVILRQKCGTISKREIQQKNCKLFQTTQTLARELTICSSPREKAPLGPSFVEGGGWTFAKMLSYKKYQVIQYFFYVFNPPFAPPTEVMHTIVNA